MIKSSYNNNFEIIRPAEVVYSMLENETHASSNSYRDTDEMKSNANDMSREINTGIAYSHYDGTDI